MIGTIEVRCSAHRPQMPLQPLFTFCGSPSSVRIRDVPKSIGDWSIDEVKLVVKYPDNSTTVKNAVRTGCVWVATIQGTDIAGKVSNGYEIVASGKDENGNEVDGYVLGSGDVIVINRDVNATKDIEKFYVKWNDELPTNPAKGDLVYHNSVFQMFNGSEWMKFGVDPTVIEGIEQEIAEANAKIDEVSHKVTSEDENQYINGEGEIWKKENGYTPWAARYVGYDPDPQANIHWAGNDETGDGMWILLINGVQQLTNPNPISTDKTATHLEFKHNDDGQWHDMVADREAVEGQWTKKDDLATKSEAALIKSIAAEAKGMADQVHDDIWASGGVKDDITTLQDTKASIDVTNVLRTDVEDCQQQIAQLFESKITEPENIAKGQILKVVEVQNTQGASLLGVSPLATPTLQWEAVDPDVVPTKTSQLQNDSDFTTKTYVDNAIGNVLTQEEF